MQPLCVIAVWWPTKSPEFSFLRFGGADATVKVLRFGAASAYVGYPFISQLETHMLPLPQITRVVTGHDEHGKAIVLSNGKLPSVHELKTIPGLVFHEVWNTSATPAPISANEIDPTLAELKLPPPGGGTRFRFVDAPPDSKEFLARGHEYVGEQFAEIGDKGASTALASSPHPLMHRTETIDYGVVIEGSITLVLDDSEVDLGVGDVVIQRGTNHAWANRSDKLCRMLFVLIDARFDDALKEQLNRR